jgi:SAM-dependent methyltransferase
MSTTPFDDLSEIYEALIDWPRRLANETPFYQRLFKARDVRSLVDVACGTGQHAAMFHSWGLRVEGSDISPAMIYRARQRFGEPEGLRWAARGFDRSAESAEHFDAALCVGNSLALAADLASVERAIAGMLQAVRRGGTIVVHVLNLWRLDDGPCLWQKCKRTTLPQGDVLIVKGVHRCGAQGFVDLIVATLEEEPVLKTESVSFLGLQVGDLDQVARRSGAADVRFFGGYHDQPYDPAESTDLIMVAAKE